MSQFGFASAIRTRWRLLAVMLLATPLAVADVVNVYKSLFKSRKITVLNHETA